MNPIANKKPIVGKTVYDPNQTASKIDFVIAFNLFTTPPFFLTFQDVYSTYQYDH